MMLGICISVVGMKLFTYSRVVAIEYREQDAYKDTERKEN